jgi:uncharacterized protein YbjT (DUF2867 family)
VVCVGRSRSGETHPKVRDVVTPDLANLAPVERELAGADACLFSLGVTAVGLTEAQYTAITFDLTLAVAKALARINPALRFLYVSGQGTDSTEKGPTMWARVKGRTENALLALPIESYMIRPGAIIPLDGITSRTGWYNAFYVLARPLYPVLKRIAPSSITDTRKLGRAMIAIAARGSDKRIIETPDINRIGA